MFMRSNIANILFVSDLPFNPDNLKTCPVIGATTAGVLFLSVCGHSCFSFMPISSYYSSSKVIQLRGNITDKYLKQLQERHHSRC